MQIFSKSYLNICNLLNINKIQRYNLLQRKRRLFAYYKICTHCTLTSYHLYIIDLMHFMTAHLIL